jgi:hypothetical protein
MYGVFIFTLQTMRQIRGKMYRLLSQKSNDKDEEFTVLKI